MWSKFDMNSFLSDPKFVRTDDAGQSDQEQMMEAVADEIEDQMIEKIAQGSSTSVKIFENPGALADEIASKLSQPKKLPEVSDAVSQSPKGKGKSHKANPSSSSGMTFRDVSSVPGPSNDGPAVPGVNPSDRSPENIRVKEWAAKAKHEVDNHSVASAYETEQLRSDIETLVQRMNVFEEENKQQRVAMKNVLNTLKKHTDILALQEEALTKMRIDNNQNFSDLDKQQQIIEKSIGSARVTSIPASAVAPPELIAAATEIKKELSSAMLASSSSSNVKKPTVTKSIKYTKKQR